MIATQVHGLYPEVLPIKFKFQALQKKDELGENHFLSASGLAKRNSTAFCSVNDSTEHKTSTIKRPNHRKICSIDWQVCISSDTRPGSYNMNYNSKLCFIFTFQHNYMTTLQKIFSNVQKYFELHKNEYEFISTTEPITAQLRP